MWRIVAKHLEYGIVAPFQRCQEHAVPGVVATAPVPYMEMIKYNMEARRAKLQTFQLLLSGQKSINLGGSQSHHSWIQTSPTTNLRCGSHWHHGACRWPALLNECFSAGGSFRRDRRSGPRQPGLNSCCSRKYPVDGKVSPVPYLSQGPFLPNSTARKPGRKSLAVLRELFTNNTARIPASVSWHPPATSYLNSYVSSVNIALFSPIGVSVLAFLPLAYPFTAIIIAIRNSRHGVYVESLGYVIVQEHTTMMIKFNDEYG